MGRVDQNWHKDAKMQSNPHELVGRKFVHKATGGLYVVTGYTLNASTDCWSLLYDRLDESKQKEFGFSRDMHEFLDGRFMEVS